MANFKKAALAIVLAAAAWSATARASGKECLYNGQKWDERNGTRPEHFTGEYTCKDADTGKLVLRQRQVDGKPDGDSTTFDRDTGKVEEASHYLRGRVHGVKRQYSGGVLELEYAYVNGQRAGVQKEMKDGVLARVYLMTDDQGADTDLHFNKKGQLTMIACGKRPIGKQDAAWCGRDGKQSTVTLYDDQGRARATAQYQWGQEHGAFKTLDPATGKVLSEERYDKGQKMKDGQRLYDRNGELLVKTDCDDKRASCTETELFAAGKQPKTQPKTVTVWKGARIAKRTTYYQNGNIAEELERLPAGDRFTIVTRYDNGRVESKGTYVLADAWYWRTYLPDGVVEFSAEDGTLQRRETYREGRLQGHLQRFWIREEARMREESEYDKDQLIKQRIYSNDILSEENEYFPDGSLKSHKDHSTAAGARL